MHTNILAARGRIVTILERNQGPYLSQRPQTAFSNNMCSTSLQLANHNGTGTKAAGRMAVHRYTPTVLILLLMWSTITWLSSHTKGAEK